MTFTAFKTVTFVQALYLSLVFEDCLRLLVIPQTLDVSPSLIAVGISTAF